MRRFAKRGTGAVEHRFLRTSRCDGAADYPSVWQRGIDNGLMSQRIAVLAKVRFSIAAPSVLVVLTAVLGLAALAPAAASADVFFASKWGSAGTGAGQISYAQTV